MPTITGIPWSSLEESYPSAETQSVYSTAPADWDTIKFIAGVLTICRDAVGVLYCPADSDTMKFLGGVLTLCRDTVGVFYCLSCLGYHEIHWRRLIPLQRHSRCILVPTLTRIPWNSLGESYPSAETQSVNYTAPAYWDTMKFIEGVLTLCRDAVGDLYCPSILGYHGIHWRSLNPLQRRSWWIILPKLTGITWNSLEES